LGSNDLCLSCSIFTKKTGFLNAESFDGHIRRSLEKIRLNIPKTLVLLVGTFNVSHIVDLTHQNPACEKVRKTPWAFVECPCAFIMPSMGKSRRQTMDEMAAQYNNKLNQISLDYQRAHYDDFAVIYDPSAQGTNISSFPHDVRAFTFHFFFLLFFFSIFSSFYFLIWC